MMYKKNIMKKFTPFSSIFVPRDRDLPPKMPLGRAASALLSRQAVAVRCDRQVVYGGRWPRAVHSQAAG